jgi:hypothetical protein
MHDNLRGCTEVDKRVARWTRAVSRQVLQALLADPSTGPWLSNIELDAISFSDVVCDEETSRHMSDDRELLELGFSGPGVVGFLHMDLVHNGARDSRGRCIFFDVTANNHEMQGTVVLPLVREGGHPMVTLAETDEEVDIGDLGIIEDEDDILVFVRNIEHSL